ncbi:MAG: hypothetical protein ACI9TH_002673 [Kiritimatiellia bacterium]|jgi:hypothetical protein
MISVAGLGVQYNKRDKGFMSRGHGIFSLNKTAYILVLVALFSGCSTNPERLSSEQLPTEIPGQARPFKVPTAYAETFNWDEDPGEDFLDTFGEDSEDLPPGLNASLPAFDLEQQANNVASYDCFNGKLDVEIGAIRNTIRQAKEFSFEELEYYYKQQNHKELMVVVVGKHNFPEKFLQLHLKYINDYFFKCGFRRVVIQQAYSSARGTHSDLINPALKEAEPNESAGDETSD